MYLSAVQHDNFRTLLMSFEIPFRAYIADKIITDYPDNTSFDSTMKAKCQSLQTYDVQYLRDILPKMCSDNKLAKLYDKFISAYDPQPIVINEIEVPMVGQLNLVTFALTSSFIDLYNIFSSYTDYCMLAEKYRYARNKLDHPGTRTLDESHLIPVLSFVQGICNFLDDKYFIEKNKDDILQLLTKLSNHKIKWNFIENFIDIPFNDNIIVCRGNEVDFVKKFVYGAKGALRKKHSLCVYGYGGVGKTALVLETIKQIVADIIDGKTINEYKPEYVLFFSSKKRMLDIASENGRIIEKNMRMHFETSKELKNLILEHLNIKSLRTYRKEGIVIIDNLESLDINERKEVKNYIETMTPPEMQFIITSRNSEDYEDNYKLDGFITSNAGNDFIKSYSEENSLDLYLTEEECLDLLNLSRGNTLVLVLSLRRLSKKLVTVKELNVDFNSYDAWKSIKNFANQMPSNTYEVISEFMYKDTFSQLETYFQDSTNRLFYEILKIFAITQQNRKDEGVDITTLCILTKGMYPQVQDVVDILTNYLILEKKNSKYYLNDFAEKYIINRFLPNAVEYERLSREIVERQNEVTRSLNQMEKDRQNRPQLIKIMSDWEIISDADKINAAKMYHIYGEVKRKCESASSMSVDEAIDDFLQNCREAESITAHPYIKNQKARILQLIENYPALGRNYTDEIIKAYQDTTYVIKVVDQYAGIRSTKSYAALLWMYGQYLYSKNKTIEAIQKLEESKSVSEQIKKTDKEYYKCISILCDAYLKIYQDNPLDNASYYYKAIELNKILEKNKIELNFQTKQIVAQRNNTIEGIKRKNPQL